MIALLPFILSLAATFINIFLCVTNISKRYSINLNILFWVIIFISFFIVRSNFSNDFLMDFATPFISLDEFSFCFGVVLSALMIIFLISSFYSDDEKFYKQEMFALASLAGFGLLAMSLSVELILTLIFLEVASISIYAMIAMNSIEYKSVEAAFKYFLLSSFMSAFYLLGAAFVFGVAGSTKYSFIATGLNSDFLSIIGMILVLSMMFFKIAIFGFYRWSIDVYYGSNLNIAGFLASAFKLASFAILIKLCFLYPGNNIEILQGIFAILAILSMFAGNLLSLKETNVKKILIAAGIVHSGYIFINLSSVGASVSIYPAIFYLSTYTIVVGFLFAILNGLFGDREIKISDLNGLYKVRPTEAFAFTVICLSFIGFPYSVGFLGKLFIFSSAVESGKTYLAIFGIINTIFSVYYYLKIIISIYFSENKTALSCADSKKFGLKLLALSSILFIILEGSGIFSIISFLNLFIR
ncbi:hypothetical protein Q4Y15_001672 [Campylobacter fetus]|uniref:NADH-quinone oxidoreductase subunit N n=2 Tax=Campylobacter fetus TaxID=196 RepID=NUON_CAMFF|nr:proton-conducting transporter membrane subunit [Campylobacter fetus]A0RME1.1 RecName: Full=NADH-quinone oxidoreductase subunit N; AltName: Full=NADH dehydrogenase I subunit N; AltName: Full=NDH-1 subunit N [Campylobacter fetus subsp. fetus 82-40]ABK82541.1 proton-translocating NADH-quinone oxidoreductase, chain n, putative [Campylobacter fetus subsp. fetus 82-40]EAI3887280.1 NADH-quinone oxidoreductase subunit N [Campylobacter fetus]EAI3916551.1 NADH-quinone oxidoreductase subunit N [Campylo